MAIFNIGRVGFHRGEKTIADAMNKAMDQDTIRIMEKKTAIDQTMMFRGGVVLEGDPNNEAPVIVGPSRQPAIMLGSNFNGATITLRHLRLQLDESSIGLRINADNAHVILDDVKIYHKHNLNVGYNGLIIDTQPTADVEIKNSLIDKVGMRVNTVRIVDSNIGDWFWDDASQIICNQASISGTALQNTLIAGNSNQAQAQIANSALGGNVRFNRIQVMGDTIALTQLPIINHRGNSNLSNQNDGATALIIGNDSKINFKHVTQNPEMDASKTKLPLPKWRSLGLVGGSVTIDDAYLTNTSLKNVAKGGDLTFINVTDDSQWATANQWGAGPKLHLSNKNSKSAIFDAQDGLNSIPSGISGQPAQSKSALKKLDEMIGLGPVKNQVKQIVAQAKANAEREKRGLGNSKLKRRLGMIFAGNAGSGKTTVAKLVGQALYEAGVLPSSKFVNVGAADLVSQYVGKTAAQTHEVILKALDGVLLIDEAYALNVSSDGVGSNANSFNQDAITQLVKDMDLYANRLVVIAAGYSQPMKQFLANNQGLQSRFPNWIEFPDYSPTELKLIMRLDLKRANARLSNPQVIQILDRGIDTLLPIVSRGGNGSGNGRFVDNYVQRVTEMRDNRLAQEDMSKLSDLQLMIIKPQDVQQAIEVMRQQHQNMG